MNNTDKLEMKSTLALETTWSYIKWWILKYEFREKKLIFRLSKKDDKMIISIFET